MPISKKLVDPKNKIAKAVAPLRLRAESGMRKRVAAEIRDLIAELEKVGGRVDDYAPEPRPYTNPEHPARGTMEFKVMSAKRAKVYQVFTAVPRDYQYDDKRPVIVKLDPVKVDRYTEQCVAAAVASYDAWVYKLVHKIGDVKSAKLRDADDTDLWGFSFLEVNSVERGPEVWKTQEITNVSVLGNYFNQWPTRKLKTKI